MRQDNDSCSRFPGPAIFLIVLGLFFLVVNHIHSTALWWVLSRYWPVILILIGIGRLWDYYWPRNHPEYTARKAGTSTAWIVILILFGGLMFHSRGMAPKDAPSDHLQRNHQHEKKSVELQGAKSVVAHLEMPAGQLEVRGGSAGLLDATFDYNESEGQPQVVYNASGEHGTLEITQHKEHDVHVGNTDNHWDLQLGKNVPIDLTLSMGAGEGNLNLRDVDLSRLTIDQGVGQLELNLTGDRKANLPVEIHGGVGQATIHLPKNIGVVVHAHGGIGSIDVQGLKKVGDEYHNDAYGTSPVTMNLIVNGGIGQIELITEE
jgi:hypothetical protein